MWPFAQDPIGGPATVSGVIHIILAAIESLSTIIIVALSLYAFRTDDTQRWRWFAAGCLVVILSSGVTAAIGTASHWPTMGFFERLTIGAFEAWMVAIAWNLARWPGRLLRAGPAHKV